MANRHTNGLAGACHTPKNPLSQDEKIKILPSFICLTRRRWFFFRASVGLFYPLLYALGDR